MPDRYGSSTSATTARSTIPLRCSGDQDRGVIWKNNFGVRRGHAMVLWGCLHAVNYRYLIEYGFQDDGCITFRIGATGSNLGARNCCRTCTTTTGASTSTSTARTTTRLPGGVEPRGAAQAGRGKDEVTQAVQRRQGRRPTGIPSKFTMLRVINTQKKNVRDKFYSYDLMPARMGNSRHYNDKEECTLHDFWVTKANPKEMTYRDLPKYCNERKH